MRHQRIDAHQHVVPPAYADWLRSKGIQEAGGRELPSHRSRVRTPKREP
jgi:hypothetical protein